MITKCLRSVKFSKRRKPATFVFCSGRKRLKPGNAGEFSCACNVPRHHANNSTVEMVCLIVLQYLLTGMSIELDFVVCRMSWFAFFLLAAVHIIANYCAVRSLCLETFNAARFHVAVKAFMNSGGTNVPSVREVNLREPVVLSLPRRWVLSIGSRLPKSKLTSGDCATLKEIYEKDVYSLFVDNEKGMQFSSNLLRI